MIDIEKLQRSIKACAHHPDHDCESCEYSSDKFWCFNDELMEDFGKSMEILKGIVYCKDCRYATDIGVRDEETEEVLLGCRCLVGGIDSDYVMTVKENSYCSWGERRAE